MKIQISCRTEGILLQSSVGLQLSELMSTDGPGVNSGKLQLVGYVEAKVNVGLQSWAWARALRKAG